MITFFDEKSTNIVLKILRKAWLIMERLNTDIIAEMHTGKLKMTREREIWTGEERKELQCYRCSKRGTPECRLCKQCEVNDNV